MTDSTIKKLDATDAEMIKLLQLDGRTSNTEMAKKLNVSEATIRTRLKRLLDDEIIQIVAVSNPFKLGFQLTGNIYIYAEMQKLSSVMKSLKKLKELWYIIFTTGESNINAEFIVRDREDFNDLIYNKISSIDGIIRLETSVIMKFEKRKYDYGASVNP
jgi:Lrp/AsnC family transcriptional regulator for asnA, asnC and gidA